MARLEWAVKRALHAPDDAAPLELAALAAVAPPEQDRVCFVAHPSLRLVRAQYPVDLIWRAVIAEDDDALAHVDLHSGPVCLLVERRTTGVEVARMDEPAWRFMTELCAGCPIQVALDNSPGSMRENVLAEHLAAGRFVAFEVAAPGQSPSSRRARLSA